MDSVPIGYRRRESVRPEYTAEQIRAYYLELERLLERIERSTNHYQVLGLRRSAAIGEIKLAYQKAIVLLHPPPDFRRFMPAAVLVQTQKAVEKVSTSFSILSRLGQRVEYDSSLVPGASAPLSVQITEKQDAFGSGELKESAGKSEASVNRRRAARHQMTLPAQVTGVDRISGAWLDVTTTVDVSALGISLRMNRRVRYGSIVHLSLPIPHRLRKHGTNEPDYNVYGVVRRVEPTRDCARVVGLEFLGPSAPDGYEDCPWATLQVDNWNGIDRRRERRHGRAEVVGIEYLDERMNHIRQEVALTEDVSANGARVYLKGAPSEFNLVKVTNLNRSFESLAAVCNRFVGRDGFERLCLRFLDREWAI